LSRHTDNRLTAHARGPANTHLEEALMSVFRFPAIGLVAALILGLAPSALAQTAQQRAACQGDAKKFCGGVAPGDGRILECLAKQKGSLSDPCKAVVEAQGK
jgi:hypothetical protein